MIKLINGIDGGEGSPEAMRNRSLCMGNEEEVEEIRTFVSVSSDYYPELEWWFEVDADRWAAAKLRELASAETAEEAEEKA